MNTTFLSNVTNMDTSTAPSAVSYGASWQTLANTGISIFGVVTNLVCFAVFMSPKLKDQTYTCMKVHTLVDLLYLLIQTFSIFLSCGSACRNRGYSFVRKSVLSLFGILSIKHADLLQHLHRHIRDHTALLAHSQQELLVAHTVQVHTHLPIARHHVFWDSDILFGVYLKKNIRPDGSVAYAYASTEFSRTRAYEVISQLNMIVRIVLVIGILPAINFLLAFLFKRHFDKKKHLIMASRVSTNRVSQGK